MLLVHSNEADVQAFGISVEANSRTDYTIETAGQTYRYNSEDNVTPGAGRSDCSAVLEHNFGTGSKVVNITLRLPRSAKRDDLVARQGFQLPSIQINRIQYVSYSDYCARLLEYEHTEY